MLHDVLEDFKDPGMLRLLYPRFTALADIMFGIAMATPESLSPRHRP
jgi:hypothetical protein